MAFIRLIHILGVMPLIGVAFGQTPPGFSPEVDASLNITYSSMVVDTSGEMMSTSDVSIAPNITVSANVTTDASTTGLLIMMDLDMSAPNATANASYTTFLNWLATDVDLSTNPITIPDNQGAPYFPPSPPANTSAHRYVFLLFQQPSNFTFPQTYQRISPPLTNSARLGFDLASFAVASNLNLPVAADWISVQNGAKSIAGNSTTPVKPNPTSKTNATATGSRPAAKTSSIAGIVSVSSPLSLIVGLLVLFA